MIIIWIEVKYKFLYVTIFVLLLSGLCYRKLLYRRRIAIVKQTWFAVQKNKRLVTDVLILERYGTYYYYYQIRMFDIVLNVSGNWWRHNQRGSREVMILYFI